MHFINTFHLNFIEINLLLISKIYVILLFNLILIMKFKKISKRISGYASADGLQVGPADTLKYCMLNNVDNNSNPGKAASLWKVI